MIWFIPIPVMIPGLLVEHTASQINCYRNDSLMLQPYLVFHSSPLFAI